MNIKYPVEINLHGELVDAAGVVLAVNIVDGALEEIMMNIIDNKKTEVVNQNFL